MKIIKFIVNISLAAVGPAIDSICYLQKDFPLTLVELRSSMLNIESNGYFRRDSVAATVEALIKSNTIDITHINVNSLQLPLNQFFSEDVTSNKLIITIEIPDHLPPPREFKGFISALSGQVPNIEIIKNDFGKHHLDGEIDLFSLIFANDIEPFSTNYSITNDKNDAEVSFTKDDICTFIIETATSFALDKSLIQITEFPDAWQS